MEEYIIIFLYYEPVSRDHLDIFESVRVLI